MRFLVAGVVLTASVAGAGACTLGIDGSHFTVDGRPTFLLGISYYGALGAEQQLIEGDLQTMKARGINWIRVWATWAAYDNDVSAVDAEGKPREPYLTRLKWLVARCDEMDIVVDVTLSHGLKSASGQLLPDLQTHSRAVQTIVAALRDHANWYIDLANERNVRDSRYVGLEDIGSLRDVAKGLSPSLLITASQGGDIGKDELERYVTAGKVDFITPHRPRHAETAGETGDKTRQYLQRLADLGRVVPVHYQEPFRRGYTDFEPSATDFLADLKAAVAAGAAGWCLHNGGTRSAEDERPRRSFDLRELSLFAQLDAQEAEVVEKMAGVAAGGG